ncbi:transporter [Hymenobacter aerilatus]|uniref:Transporter n=1 Tax=Hymenobacter aerilatus TaxID=2932251 RepID=A0A8T9SQ09_9BACT|nr:transporter [Hymenobacter aerilatus]UOR03797.1 transporter [Hymenobacter aerilatus]
MAISFCGTGTGYSQWVCSRFFPSNPNSDTGYKHSHRGDPTDYEAYRVLELRGKYFLAKRLELNAFVPYAMNTNQSNAQQLNMAGVGDVTVFAGYHLIRAIETLGVQSRLIVGGGVKLPTGDYHRTNAAGQRYGILN